MLTRRTLVAGAAGAVALLAFGGATKALAGGEDELLRPPGGQDEERFAGACLRCGRCLSICPESCISLATLERGLVNARTPRMDFRRGYCTFCKKCIDVCPTTALIPFDETAGHIGIAVVDRAECLAYRSTGCKVCFEQCPYQAISLGSNNHPIVDANRCNGCGVCEYVCPSASLGSYSGSARRGINVERGA